jgi:arylsulfatase A-like enzyme
MRQAAPGGELAAGWRRPGGGLAARGSATIRASRPAVSRPHLHSRVCSALACSRRRRPPDRWRGGRRRRLLPALALAVWGLGAAGGLCGVAGLAGCRARQAPAARAAAARRLAGAARGWNLVVLTVDTLRSDRLGAYGYSRRPTSPNLDASLRSGVTFDRAFAQRAATWPSLASLLSGLYPSGHGVDENGYGFPDDLPTLPKLLRASGYRTGAFLSNMCEANHQGWDAFGCSGGRDGRTVQDALAWAGPLDAARPFLLWVHMFGAHPPYYNGGDLSRQLDPGYEGPLGPKKWRLDEVMTSHLRLDAADLRHLDALYDAAVIGSDRLAGQLLDGLRRAGKLDHTLLVMAADHGEELYAHHEYLYHACSVYQTTLHVPLGFAAPGLLPAGARVPQAVELIDVLPTLLELLAVAPPARLDGRSLVPYLERPGGGGGGKPAFSEYGGSRIHTVIQADWKLVDNPDRLEPACIPGPPGQAPLRYPIGRTELYDLARDPGETANLAARLPLQVAVMARLIDQRFSHLPRRAHPQQIPEALRKELSNLGYVAP